MTTVLLILIYIAFISLGLPDPMLGAAWPVMHTELGAELSWAGILTVIVCGGTIVSALLSERLTKRFGSGLVTAVSVGLTAIGILGYSRSTAFWQICLWAVPYGLGGGGVDAALNNYVSLHYSSRAMSWLHAFWGLGTMISPFMMSAALASGNGWSRGYLTVGMLQLAFTAVMFLSLPLWKRAEAQWEPVQTPAEAAEKAKPLTLRQCVSIPGVVYVLVAFLCYCSFESTAILWSSSFLVDVYTIPESTAAAFGSFFCIGITAGRFLSGFIANKLGDKQLVRLGVIGMVIGTVMLFLGAILPAIALAGLIVMGIGCAPVFPALIHATPTNFGARNSEGIVGVQMACAYIGSAAVPPLFGVLAQHISLKLFPFYLAFFCGMLLLATEILNKKMAEKSAHE